MSLSRAALLGTLLAALLLAAPATARAQFQQPTPGENEVGPKPSPTYPEPRGRTIRLVDVAVLAAALAATGYVVLVRRSRRWLLAVMLASLLYLGFYRSGCVCPIGAIQNVALSLRDPAYTISIIITAIFLLPLIAALLVGRVFCGGVCPFGVIQDLMGRKPLPVPRWVDRPLRVLPWLYLGAVVYFAVGGIAAFGLDLRVVPDFLICRFDPFVSLFRAVDLRAAAAGRWADVLQASGPGWIWWVLGGVLALSVVVGRPYCRWVCPYGALLGACSRASWKHVTVMPGECCDCELCSDACHYGAIEDHAAVAAHCLACARCYEECPLERRRRSRPAGPAVELLPPSLLPAPAAAARGPAAIRRIVTADEPLDLGYIDALVAGVGSDPSAALPLLQQIQARHRYLPRAALQDVCRRTGLSMDRLLGLATFYNIFRLAPIGEHLVCVCHGTACHVAGAPRITDAIRRHLHIEGDADTDAKRRFTIEHVACLGCCSLAPCMQIDGVTYGHLTGEIARAVIDDVAAGRIAAGAPATTAAPASCACSPAAIGKEPVP
ncbi:MAG: 4Fe-4S binding protein [Planctomycetes bacterium]|nr:4Fe-4S binding protein [Planctomycetota bacterium]